MTGVEVIIAGFALAAIGLFGWLVVDELTFHYQRRQYRRACDVTGLAEALGLLPKLPPGVRAEELPWPPNNQEA